MATKRKTSRMIPLLTSFLGQVYLWSKLISFPPLSLTEQFMWLCACRCGKFHCQTTTQSKSPVTRGEEEAPTTTDGRGLQKGKEKTASRPFSQQPRTPPAIRKTGCVRSGSALCAVHPHLGQPAFRSRPLMASIKECRRRRRQQSIYDRCSQKRRFCRSCRFFYSHLLTCDWNVTARLGRIALRFREISRKFA